MKIGLFIKNNWIYIAQFLFMGFIFFLMPPIGDRLMEGKEWYLMETPIRYLWAQLGWLQTTNGRVVSNIFSFVVDRNIIVRSIIDAGMVTLISYYSFKMSNIKTNSVRVMSVICISIVSWSIKLEVYFYAATLYISASLLLVLLCYFLKREWEENIDLSNIVVPIVLFASIWLENISMAVIAITGSILVYSYIKNRVIEKRNLIYFGISLLGFLFMLGSMYFATASRLTKTESTGTMNGFNISNL